MTQFEFKCPQCGGMIEADESFRGQVAECPYCKKRIVIPSVGTKHTRQEHHAMPQRFVLRPKDVPSAPGCPKSGRGILSKVVAVFCILLGITVIVGLFSCGGYLYLGDEPRLARGIMHYEKKAYSKAMKLLFPLAKKGYAKAQLYVGDCYANGNGVIMDSDEAVKWYRLAAEQDLAEAQYRMYQCYIDGIGVECHKGNAAKWCRKAAEAGYEEAMFDMGMLYVNGTGVENNARSAFRWFRKGAERGHPMSQYKFGQCYKVGFGVEKDEDEASKWQNRAVSVWRTRANIGDMTAMIRIGTLYKEGDVVELDKEEAVKWFRKAAEMGSAHAQFELANCYYTGEGVEKDAEAAAKWMLKSAEQGTLRQSQWMIGRFYEDGKGVEKNMTEAVKWFERSAKKGLPAAKYSLAMCYLKGDGVPKDEDKAEKLLEEAATDNNRNAERELHRIRTERAERAKRLDLIRASKANKINEMREIEKGILERRSRINSILKGKMEGVWHGFDASKITSTDASISIKEEPPFETQSGNFSDKDEMDKINNALSSLEKESARLEARLLGIIQVKKTFDAKELESRKETCHPCKGTGSIICARCRGNGEIDANENIRCPICDNGSVRKEVACSNCNGTGQVQSKCGKCNGKGKLRIRGVGARFDRYETCNSCNGSGWDYPQLCMRCDGCKKVKLQTKCNKCNGMGIIIRDSKGSCPVCDGKGNLKCERCAGYGFTYRPKQ